MPESTQIVVHFFHLAALWPEGLKHTYFHSEKFCYFSIVAKVLISNQGTHLKKKYWLTYPDLI